MNTIRFVVTGRVQGVGFRNYVYMEACQIAVDGYVRNQPDGSVECLATGDGESLNQLRTILHKGPPLSRVDFVSEEAMGTRLPRGFEIRH